MDRRRELGRLGERVLAVEALQRNGFTDLRNLNDERPNYPWGDLFAVRDGRRYFISVKTRNEWRMITPRNPARRINEEFNLSYKPTPEQAYRWARSQAAEPAWLAIPVDALGGTYSAYFGLLAALPHPAGIKMTDQHLAGYECLARDVPHPKITPDLFNG